MDDLSSLDIVITRPRAQGEEWQQQLQHYGARTHLLPVLEIVSVTDAAELQAVKNRILALADYHKVIFVSRNAVQQAMEWIDRYWPQFPVGIRYFAVGSATAAEAENWGLQVEAAGQAMNSEALLELSGLQSVRDEKILICRGQGGRTYLGDELRRRGAQVDYCELYHRQLPADAGKRFAQMIESWEQSPSTTRETVFAVHSGESLQNLSQVIDDSGRPALKGRCLLVPGARVAELGAQLGFQRILSAANATDQAMTQALLESV